MTISVTKKRALRLYKQANPSLSNIAVGEWFISNYQLSISLFEACEILSKPYAYIGDHPSQPGHQIRNEPHGSADTEVQWEGISSTREIQ